MEWEQGNNGFVAEKYQPTHQCQRADKSQIFYA